LGETQQSFLLVSPAYCFTLPPPQSSLVFPPQTNFSCRKTFRVRMLCVSFPLSCSPVLSGQLFPLPYPTLLKFGLACTLSVPRFWHPLGPDNVLYDFLSLVKYTNPNKHPGHDWRLPNRDTWTATKRPLLSRGVNKLPPDLAPPGGNPTKGRSIHKLVVQLFWTRGPQPTPGFLPFPRAKIVGGPVFPGPQFFYQAFVGKTYGSETKGLGLNKGHKPGPPKILQTPAY